jgi:hypothetical protein
VWTPVIQKRVSNKVEKYTLTLSPSSSKKQSISVPVGFKNGTKVIVRYVSGKKAISLIVKVKNGMITFRPIQSGTYEIIKK